MSFDTNAWSVGKGSRCSCKQNMQEKKDFFGRWLNIGDHQPSFEEGPHKIDNDPEVPDGVLCLLCNEKFTKQQYCTDLKGYHTLIDDPEGSTRRFCSRCELTFTRQHECEVFRKYHEWAPAPVPNDVLPNDVGLVKFRCRHCGTTPLLGSLDELASKIPDHITDYYIHSTFPPEANEKPTYITINVPCEEHRSNKAPEQDGTLHFECPFCYKSYKKDGQPRAGSKRIWHHHGRGEGSRIPHCVGPRGGGSADHEKRLGFQFGFDLRKSGIIRYKPY